MKLYDLIAPFYDAFIDESVHTEYVRLVKKYAAKGNVLEAACGTAKLSRMLAKDGYDVTAFDQSEAMLEAASQEAGESGVDVRLYRHDVAVPFMGTYDVVLLAFDVLNHLTSEAHMQRVIDLMHARLSKDGLFITDFLSETAFKKLIDHHETIHSAYGVCQWTVETYPAETMAIKHRMVCGGDTAEMVVKTYPLTRMMQLFAGFSVIETVDFEDRRVVVCKR